jgi:hypothetical protein
LNVCKDYLTVGNNHLESFADLAKMKFPALMTLNICKKTFYAAQNYFGDWNSIYDVDWQNVTDLDLGCRDINSFHKLRGIDWKKIRKLQLWGNNFCDL